MRRSVIDLKLKQIMGGRVHAMAVIGRSGRCDCSAEEDLGFSLIIKKKGGSTRAGSVLTPEGQCLLTQFQEFESAVHKCVDQLFQEYFVPDSFYE